MQWLMDNVLGPPAILEMATRGQHQAALVSLPSGLWGLLG